MIHAISRKKFLQLYFPGKRKRDSQDNPYLQGVSTPDTPYGAFLHGPNPNTQTRKYYKKHCENMGKFELPEEEIQAKKAKFDNENNQNLDQSVNGSSVVPVEAENQAEDSPKIQPVNENLRYFFKGKLVKSSYLICDFFLLGNNGKIIYKPKV